MGIGRPPARRPGVGAISSMLQDFAVGASWHDPVREVPAVCALDVYPIETLGIDVVLRSGAGSRSRPEHGFGRRARGRHPVQRAGIVSNILRKFHIASAVPVELGARRCRRPYFSTRSQVRVYSVVPVGGGSAVSSRRLPVNWKKRLRSMFTSLGMLSISTWCTT